MRKRRAVLKSIGAGSCLGLTGVVTGNEPDVKVITKFREVGNGMNTGQITAAQKSEFASFVKEGQFVLGSAESKTDGMEVVGLAAAVNRDGQTRRFVGATADDVKVSDVHNDVRKYARKFREEL